jgi:hypothetical protein
MTHTGTVLVGIYIICFLLSIGYCWLLSQITYAPRYTHMTVVAGNAFIGLTMLVFCALGILPWLAFWLLLYANIAWGIPVIIWWGRKTTDQQAAAKYHRDCHECIEAHQRLTSREGVNG